MIKEPKKVNKKRPYEEMNKVLLIQEEKTAATQDNETVKVIPVAKQLKLENSEETEKNTNSSWSY